jgi:hypothetical protein
MKFEVTFPIIRGLTTFQAEADTREDAIDKVLNGDGEYIDDTRIETDFTRSLASVVELT